MSLTARITALCVGVALVTAVVAGFAGARFAVAEDRAASVATAGPSTRQADRIERRAERRVTRAVLVSVALGLGVGALAGGAAARVLTGPLRRTAGAARALAGGRRDVRVPVEGPPEVAEVAAGMNALADALVASEGRQRRFLLSVSHELRNPLTAVRGFAESVADGVVTGDAARDAGGVILTEAGRLEHLVRDLLDLARLGADDFRLDLAPVDAAVVLDEAARVWSDRAGVTVERPGVPLPVRTDAARLRQVLDGLTDNAVRVTPAGRPVVLAARPPGPWDPPGSRAVLEVRDGGPGLSPQDRAIAFEPGALGARYRDERPVGVGIGLSLVHGLVSRLGGVITVDEAPEGGARFTVTLPDAPWGHGDGPGPR